MHTYSENKYYFYHTNVTFIANDTLILEKKTLFSYSKEAIPLVAFNPEAKIEKKHLSRLARLIFLLELVAFVGFFITLIRAPQELFILNIPLSVGLIGVFTLLSIAYYRNVTKNRLYFCYNNGLAAVTFSYNKKNLALTHWIEIFDKKIRTARLNFDQENFNKMRKGIESLEKQRLINPQFAIQLHNRLAAIADIKIK